MPYDPSEGRVRVALAPASSEDRLTDSGWIDHRLSGETLGLEQTPIRGSSLVPGGQRTPGTQGKIRTTGPINIDLEPEGLALYFALYQRRGRTPVELATGAYRHWLSPSSTDLDFTGRRLQTQIYRDDAAIQNSYGAAVGGFQVSTQPDQVWAGQVDLVSARSDYWGFPVQIAGSSDAPYIRGLPRLDLLEGATELRVKVISTTPLEGDLEIALTTDAVAYGAANVSLFEGRWTRVVLSTDGSAAGKAPSHVELLWPSVAGLAVDDEWSIPLGVQAPWVAALPTIDRLSEVESEIRIDGQVVAGPITSASLQASQTAEPDLGIGGVWPSGVHVGGQREITWQLDRRMVDNTLQRRLETAEPIHLDVVLRSQVTIGATAIPYQMRIVSPYCVLSGTRPTLTDPNTQAESYQLEPGPAPSPDAEGFVDDLTLVLDNGISSLI